MRKEEANIYPLLDQLKVRKALYLGNDYTFRSLDSFISGFIIAASDGQLESNAFPNFTYFSTWLLGHITRNFGLGGGWHWQITNRNLNDDKKSFEDFFYFLEIFKTSKTHSKSMILDKEAIDFMKTSGVRRFQFIKGEEFALNENPTSIVWKTIENSTTVWLDYIGEDGKAILEDRWHINAGEAMDSLSIEFGSFTDRWTANNE